MQVKSKFEKNNPAHFLRVVGLKATPARKEALEFIAQSRAPVSAQEVIEKTKSGADPATIYRILRVFEEKRIIRQVDMRHNHAHYEFFDYNDHHHVICVYCGRVEDVKGCEVERIYEGLLQRTESFVKIREHSLEFYGVCKTCVQKTIRAEHSPLC